MVLSPSSLPRGLVVAVDGPSGSGKSTLCRRAASALGAAYLDTGAMYRAVCWAVLEAGSDPRDPAAADAVARAARSLDLRVGTDPAAPSVAVGERDVTSAVRESRISAAVSGVATNPAVRAELVARQRALVAALAGGGVVAEGRDLTTVVAPDADVRALVVVDVAARLARRARELHGSDDEAALAATRDEVVRRDADDSTVASFTTPAPGVVVVDNSGPLQDAVDALVALATAADARDRAPAGADA